VIKVTELWSAADDLARFIATNNYTKESIENLFIDLELSDSAKQELDKYFFKNNETWEIWFARVKTDENEKSNLSDFINQSN